MIKQIVDFVETTVAGQKKRFHLQEFAQIQISTLHNFGFHYIERQ